MYESDVCAYPPQFVLIPPTTRIVSVNGSEDVAGDWQITGDLTLQVRAERSGKASRVYTVTVESRDGAGNASTRTVTVTVR